MFMIGYLLHRSSFKDSKKVGVAIYANELKILRRPQSYWFHLFVHVDIVDSTFNQDANTINTYRLEAIRAYWPNKEIHVHIMSKTPWFINEIIPYSDVVFIHAEIEMKFMIYVGW